MFAYCGNNPIVNKDSLGSRFQRAISEKCIDPEGRILYDFVIYYYHTESSSNLDDPAFRNYSGSTTSFVGVGSFDEFANAMNSIPQYANDIYIYLHSDDISLSFYYAQYYSSMDISNNLNELKIHGNIYLFSCKGGRGDLASTMANTTNCTVIASVYKVSFGLGKARCGWENYLMDVWDYGLYSWYSFHPDGSSEPFSYFAVCT